MFSSCFHLILNFDRKLGALNIIFKYIYQYVSRGWLPKPCKSYFFPILHLSCTITIFSRVASLLHNLCKIFANNLAKSSLLSFSFIIRCQNHCARASSSFLELIFNVNMSIIFLRRLSFFQKEQRRFGC